MGWLKKKGTHNQKQGYRVALGYQVWFRAFMQPKPLDGVEKLALAAVVKHGSRECLRFRV